ncbi:FHA domain-containing protein DDL, partial [Tanacetum coccineum]
MSVVYLCTCVYYISVELPIVFGLIIVLLQPDIRWRFYVFKGGESLDGPFYVHRQTCYLFGRERRVADIPTDHPSCSKQHAVLQYRQIDKELPEGMLAKETKPNIMDLGSTSELQHRRHAYMPSRMVFSSWRHLPKLLRMSMTCFHEIVSETIVLSETAKRLPRSSAYPKSSR